MATKRPQTSKPAATPLAPRQSPSPRRPQPSAAGRAEARRLLALLNDPAFRSDSAQVAAQARMRWEQLERAGETATDDDYRAIDDVVVRPFMARWKAGPLWALDVVAPDPRYRSALAVQSGRWALSPPLFAWTDPDEAVRLVRARLHALRKLARDEEEQRRGVLARWLEMHDISREDIAVVLWKRRTGLRRRTPQQASRHVTPEQESALMARAIAEGMSYFQAERAVMRRARGSEAPAVAMVRKGIARAMAAENGMRDALLGPKSHDPVSALLTQLTTADAREDWPEVSRLIRDLRLTLATPPSV